MTTQPKPRATEGWENLKKEILALVRENMGIPPDTIAREPYCVKDIMFAIDDFLCSALSRREQKVREKLVEKIEKVFDQFRSSNIKDKKGKRDFGVGNFSYGVRNLYEQILHSLEAMKGEK